MSDLAAFLGRERAVVRARLLRVRGSSPREQGAAIFVAPGAIFGTIGGGQLEYMVIDQARQMLTGDENHTVMNVPLGPEIGQCCGGRVEVELQRMNAAARVGAIDEAAREIAARPEVLIFGAGHVGRALVQAMRLLPVRLRLIDSRGEELGLAEPGGERVLTALPEAEVRAAGAGAAYVILTHDHALDFLLAAEALGRGDAGYVGMIGSATKRARFEHWARAQAGALPVAQLVCPMAPDAADKRPEVIAAFVAAEVMAALLVSEKIHTRMENRMERQA